MKNLLIQDMVRTGERSARWFVWFYSWQI